MRVAVLTLLLAFVSSAQDATRLAEDATIIVRRLQDERDVSVRRALILSLGGFGPPQIPEATRQALIPRLLDWYRNDPDAGIHSAIDWLLRHGMQGEKPRVLD